jgi:uncharacterized protein YegL/transposase-like protein
MIDLTLHRDFDKNGTACASEACVACVLVLDISLSMVGRPIAELNNALVTLKDTLAADRLASKRVEIAIITFGGVVEVVQAFITAENFVPPVLEARGNSPMGQAVERAIDLVEERREACKRNGIAFYRPCVLVITDGGPSDCCRSAANRVRWAESDKLLVLFAAGVENADMEGLKEISVRDPIKIRGVEFRQLILCLSNSIRSLGLPSVDEDSSEWCSQRIPLTNTLPDRDWSLDRVVVPVESRLVGPQRELTTEERRAAVLGLLRGEEKGPAIARRFGVLETSVSRWRDDFLAAGEAALAGGMENGAGTRDWRIAELERPVEKRGRVIGELTVAGRDSKKVSGGST